MTVVYYTFNNNNSSKNIGLIVYFCVALSLSLSCVYFVDVCVGMGNFTVFNTQSAKDWMKKKREEKKKPVRHVALCISNCQFYAFEYSTRVLISECLLACLLTLQRMNDDDATLRVIFFFYKSETIRMV